MEMKNLKSYPNPTHYHPYLGRLESTFTNPKVSQIDASESIFKMTFPLVLVIGKMSLKIYFPPFYSKKMGGKVHKCPNVWSFIQLDPYTFFEYLKYVFTINRSEQISKRASNGANMSPVSDMTHQQIMPCAGDTLEALDAHLLIYLLMCQVIDG